jgi:hypothetical protein
LVILGAGETGLVEATEADELKLSVAGSPEREDRLEEAMSNDNAGEGRLGWGASGKSANSADELEASTAAHDWVAVAHRRASPENK